MRLFATHMQYSGTIPHYAMLKSPKRNGVAKRYNFTLKDMTKITRIVEFMHAKFLDLYIAKSIILWYYVDAFFTKIFSLLMLDHDNSAMFTMFFEAHIPIENVSNPWVQNIVNHYIMVNVPQFVDLVE